jgi:hypothetical protein
MGVGASQANSTEGGEGELPAANAGPGVVVRASGLALWGAMLSVGSVAGCVVSVVLTLTVSPVAATAVLALPVVSFLGAGVSAMGLRVVARSGGSLAGRPIAIAGLLIGLVAGVLQGAAALSALGTMWAVRRDLVPVVEAMVLAHGRGDRSAFRAALGETVSRHLSDDRVDWFFEELSVRVGEPRGARFDLGVMARAAVRLRGATAGAGGWTTVIENPKPIELVTDRGAVPAFVMPDDEAMRVKHRVAVGDVLVMLPGDEVLTLRSEGPAAALAMRLGWRVVEGAR